MKPKLRKKQEEVDLLLGYIKEHDCVGLVHFDKISARIIQNLRKKLRGKVTWRLSKKRIQIKALKEAGRPNLDKLVDLMEGSSALLFTNMDPLALRQILEENKEYAPPKGGDIAPREIQVSAGNTGIAPGPIISEFNEVLRVQTRIQDGTVWIREDKVTHKEGDHFSQKAAALLGRLGIKPMEVMLDLYAAWENGEILPRDVLYMDLEEKQNEIRLAISEAMNLALACNVVDDLTVRPMIQRAVAHARQVAMELPDLVPGLEDMFLTRAIREARAIEAVAFGSEAPADEEPEETEVAEEEPPEEKKEKPTGLGALFG